MSRGNLILLGVAAGISALPLMMGGVGGFGGSDDQGMAAIGTLAPDYRPWFKPLWMPPSGEVENLLFSLQAAAGAGLLGYYFGYRRGRQRGTPDGAAPGGATRGEPRAGD